MMDHGGDVWQGSGPGQWLDFSASLRPEGPPDWVLEAMARALEAARYYPQRSMDEARRGLCAYAGVEPARLLPTAGRRSRHRPDLPGGPPGVLPAPDL